MCGPGCWKLLHGYYRMGEEPEEKPKEFRKGKGGAHPAEGEGEEEPDIQEVEADIVDR